MGNWGARAGVGGPEEQEVGTGGMAWAQGAEGGRQDVAGGGAQDKAAKEEEPEALGAILSF